MQATPEVFAVHLWALRVLFHRAMLGCDKNLCPCAVDVVVSAHDRERIAVEDLLDEVQRGLVEVPLVEDEARLVVVAIESVLVRPSQEVAAKVRVRQAPPSLAGIRWPPEVVDRWRLPDEWWRRLHCFVKCF